MRWLHFFYQFPKMKISQQLIILASPDDFRGTSKISCDDLKVSEHFSSARKPVSMPGFDCMIYWSEPFLVLSTYFLGIASPVLRFTSCLLLSGISILGTSTAKKKEIVHVISFKNNWWAFTYTSLYIWLV
jgi:hypothetical protein